MPKKPPFPTNSSSGKKSEPCRGGSVSGAPGNASGPGGTYQKSSGSGSSLSNLPGRMSAPPGGSHFKSASSQGSTGPSPDERLRQATTGKPAPGKGPGRGTSKT